jgi:hypothetical protein
MDPLHSLKDLGPYAIYLNQLKDKSYSYSSPHDGRGLDVIQKVVEEIITDSCVKYDRNLAQKVFNKLFAVPKDVVHYKNAAGGSSSQLFSNVVTTNYDLVIENLRNANRQRPYHRGFKPDETSEEKYLAIDEFDREDHQVTGIEYLKLHGSIDWWLRKSDNRIVLRESPYTYGIDTYPGQMMVYPIYEKYISKDPFFSLHSYFRKLLYYQDIYVVIGYSFRDPSINNAFADMLRKRAETRMIIINPAFDSIRKNIEQFPEKKVDVIREKLGDDSMIDALKRVLTKEPAGFVK